MAKKVSAGIKIFLLILIATSVVSLYFVYAYYNENQEKAELIKLQSLEIGNKTRIIGNLQSENENLQNTLENKEKEIQSNRMTISELTLDIQNLVADLQKKTFTIEDLNVKLTGTQQKLQDLNPTIRNYYVVGVTSTGEGVIIPIEVRVVKGSGSILVNVKNVDLGQQAQDSIRTAATVAGGFSKIDISSKDLTVTFVHEGSEIVTIDGGSGGAALTGGMVAALENRSLNTNVLITGTIESNQSIGKVGSVGNKALAAKAFGATAFLVPKGQMVNVTGVQVVEVGTLSEVASRILT